MRAGQALKYFCIEYPLILKNTIPLNLSALIKKNTCGIAKQMYQAKLRLNRSICNK